MVQEIAQGSGFLSTIQLIIAALERLQARFGDCQSVKRPEGSLARMRFIAPSSNALRVSVRTLPAMPACRPNAAACRPTPARARDRVLGGAKAQQPPALPRSTRSTPSVPVVVTSTYVSACVEMASVRHSSRRGPQVGSHVVLENRYRFSSETRRPGAQATSRWDAQRHPAQRRNAQIRSEERVVKTIQE